MQRRTWILGTALGLGVCLAGKGFAQQAGKPWRIGILASGFRPPSLTTGTLGGFQRGMRELGLVEGRDFVIYCRAVVRRESPDPQGGPVPGCRRCEVERDQAQRHRGEDRSTVGVRNSQPRSRRHQCAHCPGASLLQRLRRTYSRACVDASRCDHFLDP